MYHLKQALLPKGSCPESPVNDCKPTMAYGVPFTLQKNRSPNSMVLRDMYGWIKTHYIRDLKKRILHRRFAVIVLALIIISYTVIDHKKLDRIKTGYVDLDNEVDATNRRIVDIISVGSLLKERFQNAQENTFGRHHAIRNFFRATEKTDTDRECFTELTYDQLDDVTKFCKPENSASWLGKKLRNVLFVPKKNAGWMCAQKRPIDGLNHVLKQYKETNMELPKYLFIIDDDTYINMDSLVDMLLRDFSYEVPHLVAGCNFIFMVEELMPFPYGGFGSFISRASIQRLIQPINCTVANDKPSDPFTSAACWRLDQNNMGEKHFFTDGMSVSDLMHTFASQQPFSNATNWPKDAGYCFHSDHALAYFFNMYHIAVPDSALFDGFKFNDDLLRKYHYTALHSARRDWLQEGECWNQWANCSAANTLCHYVQPTQMLELFHKNASTVG